MDLYCVALNEWLLRNVSGTWLRILVPRVLSPLSRVTCEYFALTLSRQPWPPDCSKGDLGAIQTIWMWTLKYELKSIWDRSKSKATWMWTLKCELKSIWDWSKWMWTLSQSELRSIEHRTWLRAELSLVKIWWTKLWRCGQRCLVFCSNIVQILEYFALESLNLTEHNQNKQPINFNPGLALNCSLASFSSTFNGLRY